MMELFTTDLGVDDSRTASTYACLPATVTVTVTVATTVTVTVNTVPRVPFRASLRSTAQRQSRVEEICGFLVSAVARLFSMLCLHGQFVGQFRFMLTTLGYRGTSTAQ